MRSACRLAVLLLAVVVGGGSSLLDGCLAGCHPGAAATTTRSGHCHALSESTNRSHLQAIPGCCHDRPAGWADTNEIGSHFGLPAFVAVVDATFSPCTIAQCDRLEIVHPSTPRLAPTLVQSPLRL